MYLTSPPPLSPLLCTHIYSLVVSVPRPPATNDDISTPFASDKTSRSSLVSSPRQLENHPQPRRHRSHLLHLHPLGRLHPKDRTTLSCFAIVHTCCTHACSTASAHLCLGLHRIDKYAALQDLATTSFRRLSPLSTHANLEALHDCTTLQHSPALTFIAMNSL